MKIYIHTDLEGVSGVDCMEMIQTTDARIGYSRERLMADLNAAVDGAFAGGATAVTVLDSHGGGGEKGNFILPLLDKRADLDSNRIPGAKWWGNLNDSYDGTFFIGAHAMAGTINGFLDHTISFSIFNYWINGRKTGELGLWAIHAAHFSVPLLMVAGDDAACTEARQFFDPVECASVKRGTGRNKAVLVDLDQATERIREAARKAMALVGKAKPYKPILPMEVKLELYRSDCGDELAGYSADRPIVERLDARTVRKMTDSYLEALF